jgi:hypothetical protein
MNLKQQLTLLWRLCWSRRAIKRCNPRLHNGVVHVSFLAIGKHITDFIQSLTPAWVNFRDFRDAALLVDTWLHSPIDFSMTSDDEQARNIFSRIQPWYANLNGVTLHRLKNINPMTSKATLATYAKGISPKSYKKISPWKTWKEF